MNRRFKVFFMRFLIPSFTVIFVVAVILLHEVFQPDPGPEMAIATLTPLQSKSLDNMVEMNKLIISLALLVIGACAAIFVQKYPNLRVKTTSTTIILLTCILFAASSIFSGYVLYDNIILMLSSEWFNPANELIKWPQRLQFYAFFISVVLFGMFIVSYFLHGAVEVETEKASPLVEAGALELKETSVKRSSNQ